MNLPFLMPPQEVMTPSSASAMFPSFSDLVTRGTWAPGWLLQKNLLPQLSQQEVFLSLYLVEK